MPIPGNLAKSSWSAATHRAETKLARSRIAKDIRLNERHTAAAADRFPSGTRIRIIVGLTSTLILAGLLVPIPFSGRAVVAIGNFVHAPLFGGITLGILVLLQRYRPAGIGRRLAIRCLGVALLTFTIGALIEFLQMNLGRSAALHDVIANGLGIVAAVCWYWARRLQRDRPARGWQKRSWLLACGFLLGIAWWSPLTMLYDVIAVNRDFPMLASFESHAQLQRFYFRQCEAKLSRQNASEGKFAMEVTYRDQPYPGATLIEFVSDWSDMQTLELDVMVDDSYGGREVDFMVKVIDQLHDDDHSDTYRQRWKLTPGRSQHLRIQREQLKQGPDTRELDLGKIQYIDLIVIAPGESVKLWVDAIRLTLDDQQAGD